MENKFCIFYVHEVCDFKTTVGRNGKTQLRECYRATDPGGHLCVPSAGSDGGSLAALGGVAALASLGLGLAVLAVAWHSRWVHGGWERQQVARWHLQCWTGRRMWGLLQVSV